MAPLPFTKIMESTESAAPLPSGAGAVLLALARAAIAAELGRPHAATEDAGDWLRRSGASFITLMRADRLRGCIGTLRAHRSLREDVHGNAISAAFRDPRFAPLTHAEFEAVTVEVSVLSPL
jgi:AmmeMemoRadiSam system protein A